MRETKTNRDGNELTIRKVFESEIGRYAAILLFFVPLIGFAWTIKSDQQAMRGDIELIKQNHFTHIEQIEKELAEQKQELIELKKDDLETQKQILVILEKLAK